MQHEENGKENGRLRQFTAVSKDFEGCLHDGFVNSDGFVHVTASELIEVLFCVDNKLPKEASTATEASGVSAELEDDGNPRYDRHRSSW